MKLKIFLIIMLLFFGINTSNAQYGPVVSFTYDDGYPSWYNIGFPVYQEYGFPATVYINAENNWIQGAGQIAIDELREMQEAGWEISSHTYSHADSITESEVSKMKSWLDSLGFLNSGFSSPGNYWSHESVNIVKAYHPYMAAVASQAGGVSQPFDLYHLRRFSLTNDVPIGKVIEALDEAVENNKWLIFYAHPMDTNPSGWYQSEQLLRMAMDEVVARKIPVKTVREVIYDLYPPGCIIDCSDDTSQYPVLTTFEEGDSLVSFNTSVWNEYWGITDYFEPRFVGSPVVYCHTSNDTLPVMKFHRNVSNGEYEVRATILKLDPERSYRLYYSFNDSVNTLQYNVEVDNNSDVFLGTVTITNGQFALYTQKAEVVSGNDGFVGWAFIRLIPKPLLLNLKVFLEGPYIGSGLMSTTLNANNFIPLSSNKAYPTTTYGHYTVSNLTDIPNSDIVDWVLVELRTGTASVTTVARRTAFLKNDGTIVDTDGSSPVSFTGLSAGNYYVVVRHRNHLAIMSSSPIALSSSSTFYDFTTSQSQAFGTNALISISGIYALISGDATGDNQINVDDRNATWNNKNLVGYRIDDVTLDCQVNVDDRNKTWNNKNLSSQVP